ncbi:MAG: asparagine synthase B [Gemmatimonadetes bacterium]|nr:asparagine synthase B [Gemmatimonadota bacterium]
MCSILAILDVPGDPEAYRASALRLSRLQRHRGPDWSGVDVCAGGVLVHERLAIVDPASGAQPLYGPGERTVLAVNGEIYNHRDLRKHLKQDYPFRTESDCEIILALYRDFGAELLEKLNGIYAFVLRDLESSTWMVARDPVGVVPLYMGWDADGVLHIASEMKALVPVCTTVREFPPGHVLMGPGDTEPRPYRTRHWHSYDAVMADPVDSSRVRPALEAAVHAQLMSDVPYGVLLSGGLDSSIIAAVAARYARKRIEENDQAEAWWPRLHSFSVGLENSPDMIVAKRAAEHMGTVHHAFVYTIQEGIDALSDVIYHLETYDVTTIRAATPMYLMARRIRAMGVKMVLSGEGADEVFGGYLYFHKAPDPRAFHEETVRKLSRLHLFDCLRANKAMAAWGVEARVPFLDVEFLDVAMAIDPADKMVQKGKIEKQLLRDQFADILPEEVVKRQKEQFSDGVGYGWIDSLKLFTSERVSDAEMKNAAVRFPHNPPQTKEAYYYRSVFEDCFPLPSCAACVPGGPSIACSTPEAIAWDAAFAAAADPSGRSVRGVHAEAV